MKKNRKMLIVLLLIAAIMLTVTSCVSQKKPNQAPSAVVNIYPSQSELVDENYFYSKWTASTDPEGGAVTYRINYARTIEGLDDPTFYETVETYFLLPNLEEGIWYWRVTAMDKNGNSTKSPIWTFTINGESLPQPVDPEEIPTDPSLIVSEVENTSFTLDWPAYEDRQNPGRAVEYVIYVYDQGQGMSTRNVEEMGYWMARIAPATTAHTTDTSHTFNNMNSQTLYDWVIVAQNSASQTSVVGSSQVRTGNRAPSQPELLNPTEGATDVATDVTLSWSASVDPDGDAVKYYVYIDMVKNTNRNVTVEGIDETEYQPEGLEEGRTYYWFIMAKDANGAATRTQTNTFMTKAEGMDVPNNPTPGDGTEGMDATAPPLLEWEHDKNGAPITYTVYMSANPKKIDKKAEGLTAKNYQIQGLLEGNTRYYWAIEAKDTGTDKTTRSGVWTFKTGTIEAPEQTGAKTNSDGTQIELTYDKAMGDPSGKKDAYTVKKEQTANITSRDSRTITTYQTIETSKIERKAGTTNAYVLTLEEAIESGDKVFIDYTPGTIASTDGGKLAQYKNVAVTNRVPGEAPLVTEATASTNTIEIAFDKDMKDVPSGAKTQFSVQSGSVLKQIESVTRTASDTYTLTLKDGQSIAYGETVLISYAKGSVQAQNEAYLESFAGIAADNTVPAPQPQFVSGETSEDGLTVKVTFDRAMADPTGKHGQFHLGINETQTIGRSAPTTTIESATLNSADAKIIELGLNRAVSNGDVLTLDYTAGDVESANGAALATFTDKPISNRVPAPLPICTAATMTADGRHVEIGFSRDMKAPTAEEANQFGVLVNGYVDEIESATLSADKRVITLNLQKPIGKNNEVHLSYTKGTVAATNDGLLESFQNKKVNTDALDTIWVIKGIGWNYSRIQDAIDAQETVDGDIIMVATGTYRENVNFNGKALMLTSTWQTDPLATSTTIIDGGNNGTAAVTIGTEDHYVSGERSADYNWNTLTQRKDEEARIYYYAAIAGFTIKNGAGDSFTSTARIPEIGVPCGIHVVGLAQIAYNIITDNGNESTALNGYGIYVSEAARAVIGMNVIQNNYNSWNGAGIYLENYNDFSSGRDMGATALIAMNEIRDNKARKGAGIYIEDGVNVEGLNIEGYGEYWKHFNAPNAEVLFVEQASTQTVNSYSNNSLIQDNVMLRRLAEETEGADIYWEVEEDTLAGSLSLRPQTEYEQTEVTLNLDYTIGCEYHNGSVVFTIGENSGHNFEITAGASVVIGEEATAITTYSYSTSVATVTGIKLEAGTVTLRLTPQETPAGTVVNTISTRDLDYIMSAVGDADGNDSVWTVSEAATQNFTSKSYSLNTDFILTGANPESVQYKETNPATELKVASETSVAIVLSSIKASDDSSQTYAVITASGTLTGTDKLTGEATLIVTAEHGNTHAYAIAINVTKFVRLEQENVASGGRLTGRTGAALSTTWHDTIAQAVDNAIGFRQSTITVWEGYYRETVDFTSKPIHLMSTDPASETVRTNTVIDGDGQGNAIMIGEMPEEISSSRQVAGETIVEGFTITGGRMPAGGLASVRSISAYTFDYVGAIHLYGVDATIRNNLITENGTFTLSGPTMGWGIISENASPVIYNNEISKNFSYEGAAVLIVGGGPEIYENLITENMAVGGPAICLISREQDDLTVSSRIGLYTDTNARIYKNTLKENVGIAEEDGTNAGAAIYSDIMCNIYNRTGEVWKKFKSPAATIEFVEGGVTENRNIYVDNTLRKQDGSTEGIIEEGKEITFCGTESDMTQRTTKGTVETTPATALLGEPFTFVATYTFDGASCEATLTFEMPSQIDLSTAASITIGENARRALKAEEFDVGNGAVYLSGITGNNERVVLAVNQYSEVPAGTHLIKAIADADGTGTLYIPSRQFVDSDTASSTLIIESEGIFKVEIGNRVTGYTSFSEAFNSIGSGQTATICIDESTTLTLSAEYTVGSGKDITIMTREGTEVVFKHDGVSNRMFNVFGSNDGTALKLIGLTLRDYSGNYNPISVVQSDLFLDGCRILETGGSSAVKVSLARAVINDTLIASSTAAFSGVSGGGLYFSSSIATVTNSEVKYNTATSYAGGIYLSNSTLTIINTTISSNQSNNNAGSGGGLYSSNSTLKLISSTVTYNDSDDADGGGIYQSGGEGTLILEGTLVASNTAYSNGGGIYAQCDLEIDDCTITYNTTSVFFKNGGGLYLKNYSNVSIDNSFIAYNTTSQNGGGLYLDTYKDTSVFSIDHSVITANTANINGQGNTGSGGGLYCNAYKGSFKTGGSDWVNPNGEYDDNLSVNDSGTINVPLQNDDSVKIFDNTLSNGGTYAKQISFPAL